MILRSVPVREDREPDPRGDRTVGTSSPRETAGGNTDRVHNKVGPVSPPSRGPGCLLGQNQTLPLDTRSRSSLSTSPSSSLGGGRSGGDKRTRSSTPISATTYQLVVSLFYHHSTTVLPPLHHRSTFNRRKKLKYPKKLKLLYIFIYLLIRKPLLQ